MTRWSLFLQTLSLLHHFLGLYLSRSMYWIGVGAPVVVIHAGSCSELVAISVENKRGPYASRGDAIDAALALGRFPWEGKCCVTERRVNA